MATEVAVVLSLSGRTAKAQNLPARCRISTRQEVGHTVLLTASQFPVPAEPAQVAILNGVSGVAYAFDIGRLSPPQVEVLLKHQARRDWGDDLLQSFPESTAIEEWRGLPATIFPTLLGKEPNKDPKPFNEWCVRHIATAKAQHRYGTVVDALSRSQNENSSDTLAARLGESAASEEIPPILRISALSAIVNSDRDLVIESLLVSACIM